MVVIPGPVEFLMGSPTTEKGREGGPNDKIEQQHRKRIMRTIAIAATPVTREQFLRFLPDYMHNEMHRYPDPTCPIGGVSWYQAARYCNWLSEQEGIVDDQWCYEVDGQGRPTKLKENYLSLTGYRLPTEAEAEFATRAGTRTCRYYGETEELLPKYAWYDKNSQGRTWPVGSLMPNDLGLFDMQGNVYIWCQERRNAYPEAKAEASEDREDELVIYSNNTRVLRGGSFSSLSPLVRSAMRGNDVPTTRVYNVGIRPARTFR
jgi:formylglycine-generating enzyme required for sulfatase activity